MKTYEADAIYHTPCTMHTNCEGVEVNRVRVQCMAVDDEDATTQFYAMPSVIEIVPWTFREVQKRLSGEHMQ